MAKSLYQIEKIADDTWYINEGGLDAVYVAAGSQRAVLVDTGSGTGDLTALVRSLTDKPFDVILTHGHPDHAGGARQFEKVYLHPDDIEMAQSITLEDRKEYARAVAGEEVLAGMIPGGDFPQVVPLADGETIDLGGRTLEVIAIPGHTGGSVCFLDRGHRILFAGDSLQGLQLICAPGEDRRAVLKKWIEKVEQLRALSDEYDLIAGGHDLVQRSNLEDLPALGRGILDGSIQGKQEHIHVFDATFYHYKNVSLMMDDI